MASTPTGASPRNSATAHSLEAYVLPHVLDVVSETGGLVSSVLVGEYELVVQGQPLVRLQRRWDLSEARADDAIEAVVRAPTSGLVSRRWTAVGEAVGPTRPILSIVSSQDVLVVARFARGALPRLRSARPGSVLIGGSSRQALPARIVTIVEVPDGGRQDDLERESGPVRVILRLGSASAEALWPGIPAEVVV